MLSTSMSWPNSGVESVSPVTSSMTSSFDAPLVPDNLDPFPMRWSARDVKAWLNFCVLEFDLTPFCVDKFNMNGKALCLLTREDFMDRAHGVGDVLFHAFQHVRQQEGVISNGNNTINSSINCNNSKSNGGNNSSKLSVLSVKSPVLLSFPQESNSCAKKETVSSSSNVSAGIPSYVPILPHPGSVRSSTSGRRNNLWSQQEDNYSVLVPASVLSPAPTDKYSSDSNSSHTDTAHPLSVNLESPMDCDKNLVPDPKGDLKSGCKQTDGECRLLWEFIYQLLKQEKSTDLVSWESKPDLTFCINNPNNLASMWGQQKNRNNMTYEKLSRALRYYYKMKIIRKVPGKRLTYQFLQHPTTIRKGQRGARPHSQRLASATNLPGNSTSHLTVNSSISPQSTAQLLQPMSDQLLCSFAVSQKNGYIQSQSVNQMDVKEALTLSTERLQGNELEIKQDSSTYPTNSAYSTSSAVGAKDNSDIIFSVEPSGNHNAKFQNSQESMTSNLPQATFPDPCLTPLNQMTKPKSLSPDSTMLHQHTDTFSQGNRNDSSSMYVPSGEPAHSDNQPWNHSSHNEHLQQASASPSSAALSPSWNVSSSSRSPMSRNLTILHENNAASVGHSNDYSSYILPHSLNINESMLYCPSPSQNMFHSKPQSHPRSEFSQPSENGQDHQQCFSESLNHQYPTQALPRDICYLQSSQDALPSCPKQFCDGIKMETYFEQEEPEDLSIKSNNIHTGCTLQQETCSSIIKVSLAASNGEISSNFTCENSSFTSPCNQSYKVDGDCRVYRNEHNVESGKKITFQGS